MSKESKTVICEECDSEYTIKYARNMVSGTATYCVFCGEAMEVADELDDVDNDAPYSDDDYG
jgi:RNA polymerase-binding transcription factor DksA